MPMLRLQPAQNRPLTRKIKNVWPSWPSCPSPSPPPCVPLRPKFIPVSLNNTLDTGTSLREARPLCPEFIPVAFHNI